LPSHIGFDGVKNSETKFSCLGRFNILYIKRMRQRHWITDARRGGETERESKEDDNKYVWGNMETEQRGILR